MEAKKQYQWDSNWAHKIVHVVDINKVVDELQAIEDFRGKITPEFVVESSKNKKSILHGYFEWDNDKAADSWRKQQASVLLRRIHVKVISDGQEKTMRVYEITKPQFGNQNGGFKKYNTLSNEDVSDLKKRFVSELGGIQKRISLLSLEEAAKYIGLAIEALSKEQDPITIPIQKLEAV